MKDATLGWFGKDRSVLVQIGMGPEHAARRTEEALQCYQPKQVVLFGYAGGLSPALALGAAFWANEISQDNGPVLALSPPPLANVSAGPLHTVTELVTSPAGKQELFARYGAWGVDMESYAVAKVCAAQSIPLHVLRAVSDTFEHSLPTEFVVFMRPDGSVRYEQVALGVLRRPALVIEILKTMKGSKAAAAALRKALIEFRDFAEAFGGHCQAANKTSGS